jgi:hypothetical protein
MSGPLQYFIYYRVRGGIDRDDVHATVRAMQSALAARTGVSGRLMVRHSDACTWMEIYEAVDDPTAFEIALDIETQAHRLSELVEPGAARHMERFVECA